MVTIKSKKEIILMEEVCKIVAKFYEQLEKEIKPGMSTLELDSKAEKIMKNLGAIPAQKGYNPGIEDVKNNFYVYDLIEKNKIEKVIIL